MMIADHHTAFGLSIMVMNGYTELVTAPADYIGIKWFSDTSSLRLASCAGEPLNPDVVRWGRDQLGVPIHDHYGQTEGGMMVCNHHFPELQRPISPGSMGHAMPGFRIVILNSDGDELEAGEEGQLAVDTQASPLFWYRGYFNDPQRTAERFTSNGRYYLTGDSASRNTDGYISFSGRADDIITSAGYRIGPFEPESALLAHEAVAEAAVVGIADELRGEIVKAFVVLKTGYSPSPELAETLQSFVQSTLSAHAYPRQIEFISELPKTPSGKVQRFLLRGKSDHQTELH
jgi:acetyl-CoA synthetase